MNNKFILTIVGIVAVLAFGFLLNNLTYSKTEIKVQPIVHPTEPDFSEREYVSKDLDLAAVVPAGYAINDTGISIVFINNEKEIIIGRSGTNLTNINDYFSFIEEKNKLNVINTAFFNINNSEAIRATIKDEGNERITYFIYAEQRVYTISTSSPELYDDLDKVAQSFRYIPD